MIKSLGKNSMAAYRFPGQCKIEKKIEKLFINGSIIRSEELADSMMDLEIYNSTMVISSSSSTLIDVHCQGLGRFALAMDGTFINQMTMIKTMLSNNQIFRKMSSEEVLANLLAQECKDDISWPVLIKHVLSNNPGGYSFIIMTKNRIFATRDCYGIKPLILGYICNSNHVTEYDVVDGKPVMKNNTPNVITSDSALLSKLNAKYVRQVMPGEIIEISDAGVKSWGICYRKSGDSSTLCAMEYISLSQSSSMLEEQRVQNVQFRLGQTLARENILETDCVTTLPNISLAFLLGFAQVSRSTIVETFYHVITAEGDKELNIYSENVKDKIVTLVVDSPLNAELDIATVLLKKSLAKEVHLRFCSPTIEANCPFGVEVTLSSKLTYDVTSTRYLRLQMLSDVISGNIEGKEVGNIGHCFHCFGGRHSMLRF